LKIILIKFTQRIKKNNFSYALKNFYFLTSFSFKNLLLQLIPGSNSPWSLLLTKCSDFLVHSLTERKWRCRDERCFHTFNRS
jgi:hypothetical protein